MRYVGNREPGTGTLSYLRQGIGSIPKNGGSDRESIKTTRSFWF